MTKQYGIDPRLVIWIQRNTGHDLQTFSDLAKIKCLDSRRRNFSAVKKIEDIRLPSWLMIKENDFSLIGEMVKLKQLSLHDVAISDYSFLTGCRNLSILDLQDTSFSDCRLLAELPALKKVLLPPYSQMKHTEVLEHLSCLQEIKEENAEEPKAAEQPGGEGNPSEGSPASERPLHLGDTAHLSIDGMGIVLYSPEVMKSVVPGSDFLTEEFIDPKQVGEHIRKGDITAFCTGTGGDFILWLRSGYPDSIAEQEFPVMIRLAVEVRGGTLQFCDLFWLSDWNPDFPQDQVLSLADGYYHITACTKRPESGYWGDDQIVCLYFNRLEEMPKLAWQGVPHLFTEEQEADPQDADAQRQPFGLYGWLGMDMSFYSNAADNLAVVMDCGDLQVLYGAASQEGYRRLMKVMEGLGQAM